MVLDWTDKVVVVTGAGNGLGKSYATFLASRGASVVINDFSQKAADSVVAEIRAKGVGKAVANYDSVTDGKNIIAQTVKEFGRIDVLINNAGILRDKSFLKMTEKEYDDIQAVHVQGAYACTKAAWPIMRKQKFGRIIQTASAVGMFGNFGQANYSAAKFALVGFMRTLAKEGVKYNVTCNAIVPNAASQLTATVMTPELMAQLSPDMVMPIVTYLVHADTKTNGEVFEAGAGWYATYRYQRSKGVVFRTDDTFTPAAVQAKWDQVIDYTDAEYPGNMGDSNSKDKLELSKTLPPNSQAAPISWKGQTVLITGAGAGLGRSYALMYAKGGANVVVNDLAVEAAKGVVEECKALGAKAVAVIGSTLEGKKLVQAALDNFGGLHVVVANAGILRDKSFLAMTDEQWDIIQEVHAKGTFMVCHAAWPIFQKQKYGRILTTTSSVGIYGNFGQANYSAAKASITGLTKTLAIEGKKYNILCNVIAPTAGSQLTRTVWTEEMVRAFSPDYVAPVVGYLTSNASSQTYGLFEIAGGWVGSTRWERTAGYSFPIDRRVTPDDIKSKFAEICRFDEKATHPTSTADSMGPQVANFTNFENKAKL